jgi:ABC-type phosphate/phosphonate transport system permease subunit
MLNSLSFLCRGRPGWLGGAMAIARTCMARTGRIRPIVSAGGFGLHLSEQARVLGWGRAALLAVTVLAAVAAIYWVSARLRHTIVIFFANVGSARP